MPLGRPAQNRLDHALRTVTFRTDTGPQAVEEFLDAAEGQIRAHTGTEPTSEQLETALQSMAAERPLVIDVDGQTTINSLLEFAGSTKPPMAPEVAHGLLEDGVASGTFVRNPDGTLTLDAILARTLIRERTTNTDFADWATQLGAPDTATSAFSIHPTRAVAMSVRVNYLGNRIPFLLLDFGFGSESPDKATYTTGELFRLGFPSVAHLDERLPGHKSCFYTIKSGPAKLPNRIRIAVRSTPAIVIYDGGLTTTPKWLWLVQQHGFLVLLAGNFALIGQGLDQSSFEERRALIDRLVAEHLTVGAEIRRAGGSTGRSA